MTGDGGEGVSRHIEGVVRSGRARPGVMSSQGRAGANEPGDEGRSGSHGPLTATRPQSTPGILFLVAEVDDVARALRNRAEDGRASAAEELLDVGLVQPDCGHLSWVLAPSDKRR